MIMITSDQEVSELVSHWILTSCQVHSPLSMRESESVLSHKLHHPCHSYIAIMVDQWLIRPEVTLYHSYIAIMVAHLSTGNPALMTGC